MSFLDDWKTEQTTIPNNEIRFFRFFAELLSKHFKGVQYYEVHGNPGHVSFESGIWPSKPPVVKELADLIIVTYSYETKCARYTVHQNKFQRTKGIQRVRPAFKFKADIHQYDLLAFRPDIKSETSLNFPKSILSGTDYDSVGSYGIFYEGDGHLIDFVYATAKWLSPQSYVNNCNLILNSFLNEVNIERRETICTIGIETFLKHLMLMQIGAPVESTEIGGFLNALILRAAKENEEDPPLIDLPEFSDLDHENLEVGSGGYRLLLVNTDKIELDSIL